MSWISITTTASFKRQPCIFPSMIWDFPDGSGGLGPNIVTSVAWVTAAAWVHPVDWELLPATGVAVVIVIVIKGQFGLPFVAFLSCSSYHCVLFFWVFWVFFAISGLHSQHMEVLRGSNQSCSCQPIPQPQHTGSKLHLPPTPQPMATPDP